MTDAKLLQAILAMDAYNQADVKAVNTGEGAESSIIGSAVFLDESPENNIGFSAVAYQVGGVIVISYRGTDTNSPGGVLSDAVNWAGGLGWETAQARAAAAFYRNIAGQYGDNIVLTGHSLGGGLAGLVATLYGKNAVLFDSMRYELSAANVYYNATTPFNEHGDNPFYQTTLDAYYGIATPQVPDSSHIGTIEVNGQILEHHSPVGSTFHDTLESGTGLALGSIDLHSVSLLAVLRYAELQVGDWSLLKKDLIVSLFNEEVAISALYGRVGGYYSAANKMRSMIAYTAIDDGPTPFGNVAIRALFDDVGNLATLANNTVIEANRIVGNLVQVAVQYSGLLALEKAIDPELILGIATHNATTVTMDMSSTKWGANLSGRIVGIENALYDAITPGVPLAAGSVGLGEIFGNFAQALLTDISLIQVTDTFTAILDGSVASRGAFLIGLAGSGQNTFVGGDATNVMVSSGTENTFDLSHGNNIVVLSDNLAPQTATFDTSVSGDPFSSQSWNMIKGTADKDTFKFTGTEKAPLTIVYGGDDNDTFDFNVAQQQGASVYLLEIEDLSDGNFLSLDPQKIAEYISAGDGHQYGGGVNKIVLINPNQDDILKYNGEIISSPTKYKVREGTAHFEYSSTVNDDRDNPSYVTSGNYLSQGSESSGVRAVFSEEWHEQDYSNIDYSLKSGNTDIAVTPYWQVRPELGNGLFLNRIVAETIHTENSFEYTDGYGDFEAVVGRGEEEKTTYYSEIDLGSTRPPPDYQNVKGFYLAGFKNGDFGISFANNDDRNSEWYNHFLTREVTEWSSGTIDYNARANGDWLADYMGTDIRVFGSEPGTFGATLNDEHESYEDYANYLVDEGLFDAETQRPVLSLEDFKRDATPPAGTQKLRESLAVDGPASSLNTTSKMASESVSMSKLWKSEDERVGYLKDQGRKSDGRPQLEQLALLSGIAASHVPTLNNGHLSKANSRQDDMANNKSGFGDLGALPDAGVKLLNVLFNKEEIRLFANAIPGTSSLQMSDGTTLLVSELAPSYGSA